MNTLCRLGSACLVTLALGAAAPLAVAQDTADKGTIAILVNSLDNPYYAAEAHAADAKARELGYQTLIQSHNEDVNRQRELISLAVGRGVKGIVLDNADSSASGAAVQYAKDQGVPTVLINREIPQDGVALAQLTHNNVQAASQVAQAFVERMGEQGEYVELTCNLADNNCVTRSEAFHQVLDQYPEMTMVARQDAKGVLLNAKQSMDSILQEHPNVRGVIAGNGPVALGAIASLQAARRDQVVVAGIDGSNDERDAVRAGHLYATAMLQAQRLASDGVVVLDAHLAGADEGGPERRLYRGILITEDNAGRVKDFSYSDE
ncbi:substrate-binding domain-containing protein [Halotalea alkalilenta]|uniref:substrate-binding domain-containing protein n=1 Tax=Halotalea alkalilenta TaxID=376489 RepID=UPI0006935A8C|nr:substrate-binding domain-containing protein [Halotalea alkalilenta]